MDGLTPSGYRIRAGTDRDIMSVISLWAAAGARATIGDERRGPLARLIAHGGALLIAESSDPVVGSLIAAWDGWRGNLYRLAVHPEWRRRGIATALVREGERHLRACGAERLSAIVADEDPVALALWRSLGYERQLDRIRFIRNNGG